MAGGTRNVLRNQTMASPAAPSPATFFFFGIDECELRNSNFSLLVLLTVRKSHESQRLVPHGDIDSDNVLVKVVKKSWHTSWKSFFLW